MLDRGINSGDYQISVKKVLAIDVVVLVYNYTSKNDFLNSALS